MILYDLDQGVSPLIWWYFVSYSIAQARQSVCLATTLARILSWE